MARQKISPLRIPTMIGFFILALTILSAFPAHAQKSQRSASPGKGKQPRPQDFSLFQPAVVYPSGGYGGQSVAVGDLNHDGNPDLVVANVASCNPYPSCGDGVVGVLLGNGDGTFQPAVGYDTGGNYAVFVAIADVNGDGDPDLVVANNSSGTVSVLLGNGDGTFQQAVVYTLAGPSPIQPDSIAVADVNHDGRPDLIVSLYGATVDVLLGAGGGTFLPAVPYGPGCCGSSSVAVADLIGDGKLDVIVTSGNSDAVGIMLGNGDGTFQSQVSYASGGVVPTAVTVADVNGDGIPDLLVANEANAWVNGFPSGPGSASVLFGNGDGTFQSAVVYSSTSTNYHSIAVADVNGDGKPDLLLAGCPAGNCGNGGDGSLAVLFGNGNGTFQPAVYFDSGSVGTVSIAVADFNHDGRLDVALANSSDGTNYDLGSVSVLLNSTGTKTSLTSSSNPSVNGQTVTFTATVKSPGGNPPDGELVAFYDGSNILGSAPLSGGVASFGTSSLSSGSHTITATYGGDSIYAASTSAPLTQEVLWSTATSLTSSHNPSGYGSPVTFTATVTSPGGLPPSGESVIFYDGSSALGTFPLRAGVATLTTSALSVGTHSITATYVGDSVFASSTSAPLNQKVVKITAPWLKP